jgi:hypothetical protein
MRLFRIKTDTTVPILLQAARRLVFDLGQEQGVLSGSRLETLSACGERSQSCGILWGAKQILGVESVYQSPWLRVGPARCYYSPDASQCS